MARGTRGRGRGGRVGRGRGRGRGDESAASLAQGAQQEQAGDSQRQPEGSVDRAGVGAGEGSGVAGGAAGPQADAAGGGVSGRVERLERMMEQVLERFPVGGQAPGQAQGVQPEVAGVQPVAAAAGEISAYLGMLREMGRISTGLFSGGARPEEADAWRSRLERNFQSLRCPEEFRVDIAVHHLEGDAHLWWRGVTSRRPQAGMVWADFLAEFDAKYFPQEAVDRLVMQFVELEQGGRSVREYDELFSRLLIHAGRDYESEHAQMGRFLRGLRPELRTLCRASRCATKAVLVETAAGIEEDLRVEQAVVVSPPVQQRRPQQQAGSSVGSKPAQGQKRKWEGTSGAGKGGRGGTGCFECGSMDHLVAKCPKKGEVRGSQSGAGCFGCGSMDHRVANCPKRKESRAAQVCFYCGEPGHIKPQCPKRQMAVAVLQPAQEGAIEVQPLQQIAASRRYTSVEAGGSSARPITGTYCSLAL